MFLRHVSRIFVAAVLGGSLVCPAYAARSPDAPPSFPTVTHANGIKKAPAYAASVATHKAGRLAKAVKLADDTGVEPGCASRPKEE